MLPKIHNLILLSQKANLKVPSEIREKIQTINTFNISARYDDYKKTFDSKCTDEYTSKQVKNIRISAEIKYIDLFLFINQCIFYINFNIYFYVYILLKCYNLKILSK